MKFSFKLCAGLLGASLLVACGQAETGQDKVAPELTETQVGLDSPAKDGRIVVSSLPKVFEPNACILPLTIRNGTEAPATVSMMQFTVTGTGELDSGNMFAQTVAPGETNTAQLLFPTRQCDELMEISAPNLTCKTGEEDCADIIKIESADDLTIKYVPQ